MNKTFLFGLAIGGATVATVYFLTKKEKVYATVESTNEEGETIEKEEEVEVSGLDKVKEALKPDNLMASLDKAFDYVTSHANRFEALTLIFTLLASMVKFDEAVKTMKMLTNKVSPEEKRLQKVILDVIAEGGAA